MIRHRPILQAVVALSLVAMVAIAVLSRKLTTPHAAVLDVDSVVLETWLKYVPTVLSSSPDGKRVLERFRDPRNVMPDGFKITDPASGKAMREFSSHVPVLRAVWRPDGQAVAYFAQDPATSERKLFVWDLRSNRHEPFPIPVSYAQPIVRWSGDGAQIGFISNPGGLVVVDVATQRVWSLPQSVKSFDWSPDSKRIAVVTAHSPEPDRLSILDRAGKDEARCDMPRRDTQEVCWQRGKSIMVLSHTEKDAATGSVTYELTEVNPESLDPKVRFQTKANVREVSWLLGGDDLLFHSQEELHTHRIFRLPKESTVPAAITGPGAFHLRTILPAGGALDCMLYDQAVNELVRVPIDGSQTLQFIAGSMGAHQPGVAHETVRLESADGTRIPVLVSHPGSKHLGNAAVIRVHASGTVNLGAERWTETQLYLEFGARVLHVPCRTKQAADDLLAACAYANKVLGVPSERIVLLGGSSGANMAVDAILRRPDAAGIVAVMGFLGMQTGTPMKPITSGPKPQLLAFHGALDRAVEPDLARRDLEYLFGAQALAKPQGIWEVIPGESHTILTDRGLARIHTSILTALHLVPPDRNRPN